MISKKRSKLPPRKLRRLFGADKHTTLHQFQSFLRRMNFPE